MQRRAPHHLEGVQEPGQLVKPLRTIGDHSIFDESIQFVDVGKTQFIKVLLALQTFNWNWWNHRNTLVRSQAKTKKLPLWLWKLTKSKGLFCCFVCWEKPTDAEEKQGLHAEELFLSDLQQEELLGDVSHPYAVFVHGGDVHSMSAGREKGEWMWDNRDLKVRKQNVKLLCTLAICSKTKRTRCQRSEPCINSAGRH